VEELDDWSVGFTPSELLLAIGDDWDAMGRWGLNEISSCNASTE
jgi:hypothetical protein